MDRPLADANVSVSHLAQETGDDAGKQLAEHRVVLRLRVLHVTCPWLNVLERWARRPEAASRHFDQLEQRRVCVEGQVDRLWRDLSSFDFTAWMRTSHTVVDDR